MESSNDSFSFWKNIILILVFMTVTPLTLGTAIFSLLVISKPPSKTESLAQTSYKKTQASGVQVFASLPANFPTIVSTVEAADARAERVRQYLEYYNSALEPFSQVLVEASDYYNLDWRLLTAIAQQESNLCKWIPSGSHNCWGWGIHSEGTLGFTSYEEGIWTVAKGLKEEYIDKGLKTPEEIMSKYTPLSKGSWAEGVSKFMAELE